jgi:hypothetical protein
MFLDIDIGQNGVKGTNVFDVLITTPEALRKHWVEYKKNQRAFPVRNVLVFAAKCDAFPHQWLGQSARGNLASRPQQTAFRLH